MLDAEVKLLIVDNDSSILFSLCQIFRHMGYTVRTAEDGFGALQRIHEGEPDILISDLNMPRMSGFELLSVVRRRFPGIYVIGMTGAFVDGLPPGIPADAFYKKATDIARLLAMVKIGAAGDIASMIATRKSAPIWVPEVIDQAVQAKRVLIGCPECLRAFIREPRVLGEPQQTVCSYCRAAINFAVVEQYA